LLDGDAERILLGGGAERILLDGGAERVLLDVVRGLPGSIRDEGKVYHVGRRGSSIVTRDMYTEATY
jgi:hypothetical protein